MKVQERFAAGEVPPPSPPPPLHAVMKNRNPSAKNAQERFMDRTFPSLILSGTSF